MLLTYSIYFSYAIFLTDYKKILKIAGGVKQLTCSPTSGSELFHARERCTVRHSCQVHQLWICGYVHVYKIIKQLFHACSGNLRPHATVLKSSPAPRDNSFDCSLNRHEITVYYLIMVFFRRN